MVIQIKQVFGLMLMEIERMVSYVHNIRVIIKKINYLKNFNLKIFQI